MRSWLARDHGLQQVGAWWGCLGVSSSAQALAAMHTALCTLPVEAP